MRSRNLTQNLTEIKTESSKSKIKESGEVETVVDTGQDADIDN